MIDTNSGGDGQTALLLHLDFGCCATDEEIREFTGLALASEARVMGMIRARRRRPDARYFVGSGKAEEIRLRLAESRTRLLIVNNDLSPSQERNLEHLCKARVLDRSGLILDIFSRRARSYEGKLQVELAQLEYLSTRLVRGWSHLERQKGGIGLRGPGEKQLETDRRLIRARIKRIKRCLDKIKHQRRLGRRLRKRNKVPTVALVGYTNAGKSTLFNRLTSEKRYTADLPFATLDTLMRAVRLDKAGSVILSDTVGFVRGLPHTLIEAFNATLLELREADLLLHVIDVSHREHSDERHQVDDVLTAVGADTLPKLLVFNKVDLVCIEPRLVNDAGNLPTAVFLSAATGAGLNLLKQAVASRIAAISPDLVPGSRAVPKSF